MIGELKAQATELVDGMAAELRRICSAPIDTRIAAGKPVPFLEQLASTASRVVVGQETATLFDRMTFGSVAAQLAATAPCPVVIVPASWHPTQLVEHPVVALSGDHPVEATLATAISEAARLRTSLLILHLVRDSAHSDDIDQHEHAIAALVAAAQQAHPKLTIQPASSPATRTTI